MFVCTRIFFSPSFVRFSFDDSLIPACRRACARKCAHSMTTRLSARVRGPRRPYSEKHIQNLACDLVPIYPHPIRRLVPPKRQRQLSDQISNIMFSPSRQIQSVDQIPNSEGSLEKSQIGEAILCCRRLSPANCSWLRRQTPTIGASMRDGARRGSSGRIEAASKIAWK